MNIPWDDLKLFLAVAETGSLSAAAKRLSVAQPTASRRIADLEEALGEALFVRGVEGTKLTPFGERLLGPATRMAEWAAEAERAAEHPNAAPAGVVRITAPPGVTYEFVAPFAAWLAGELPLVRIEAMASIQYVDLVRREADLALRTQRPTQRDLVCLASISFAASAFAARAYAQKLPRRPQMADVAWIAWTSSYAHVAPNPQLARAIPGFTPAFASDDYLVQLRACEAGLGAMFMGHVKHRFTRDMGLVPLDLDIPEVPASLHLVCARSALAIPRIRAVADLLVKELERAETKPARPQGVSMSR